MVKQILLLGILTNNLFWVFAQDRRTEISDNGLNVNKSVNVENRIINEEGNNQLKLRNDSPLQMTYYATGRILRGYVPEASDLWGSVSFQDINSKQNIWLSYFGQKLGTGDIDGCICCDGSKYRKEIVDIKFVRTHEWVPINVVAINEAIDTLGKINQGFNKRDSIICIKGVLRSADSGDYATYISLEQEDGSIREFSYGYLDIDDNLVNQKVKLVAVRETINYLEKCRISKRK